MQRFCLENLIIIVGLCALFSACTAGEKARNPKAIFKEAKETQDAEVLQKNIAALVADGSDEAVGYIEKLLTEESRLKLLWPYDLSKFRSASFVLDSRLFKVLRWLSVSLEGQRASELFSDLFESANYVPKGTTEIDFIREGRRAAVIVAAGNITEPTEELIGKLRTFADETWKGACAAALIKMATKSSIAAALKILEEEDAGSRWFACRVGARRRDRPQVFRFLVECYIRSSLKEANSLLTKLLLADHFERGNKSLGNYISFDMPKYESIAAKHAQFYVKQFDRLLDQKKHPIADKQRKELQKIRDMLAKKAEKYKKQQREKKKEAKKQEAE